ncbi:MAG: putative molybdenum carrier protein [Pseudomonadota bacterium]
MKQIDKGGYRQRSLRNARDADATLIIYFGELGGGAALTVEFCIKNKELFKLIDGDEVSADRAVYLVREFAKNHEV